MTQRTMYDAATPPATFGADPWAGYLHSPHHFAIWPVDALSSAMDHAGVLPIFGAPLTAAAFAAADAEADARLAMTQLRELNPNELVCALDLEEGAYEAAPREAGLYVLHFVEELLAHDGVPVVYSGKTPLEALTGLIGAKAHPWLAEWTDIHSGFPLGGWDLDPAWQYAGNVHVGGKLVDVSTLGADFPLLRPHNHGTHLSVRARHAVHVLDDHLHHRLQEGHAVDDHEDRAALRHIVTVIDQVLDLGRTLPAPKLLESPAPVRAERGAVTAPADPDTGPRYADLPAADRDEADRRHGEVVQAGDGSTEVLPNTATPVDTDDAVDTHEHDEPPAAEQ